MEFTSDVINFTKIKDGFFLGDESIASNLEVLLQFKISHIINAAGAQVINAWESIGIRYLTLNWSESPNQILFDQKDEIANKIVEFADEALKSGEGLLVHSLKGQNRACIVVMIYLMKKHRWTLAKAMEFINNKKYDIEIQKHFLNQLFLFEARLNKTGLGAKSSTFSEISNEHDHEEILLRNTYLNGLENKSISRPYTANAEFRSDFSKKIFWADKNDSNRKDLLCNVNPQKELYFIKEIKPVMNHKKMIPKKSSFKRRSGNELGLGSGADAGAVNRSPYLDRSRELQSLLALNNPNSKNTTGANFNNGFVAPKGNNNSVNSNTNNNSTSLNSSNNLSDNNREGFGYNKTAKLGNDLNVNSSYVGQNYNPNNYSIGKNHQGISSTNTSNDYSTSSYLNNQQAQKQINTSSISNSRSVVNNNNTNISANSTLAMKRGEASNYSNKENRNSITPPSANQRSFSYDQKNDNNNNNNKNNFSNNNQKKEVTKIIISPQIQNVFNHNINNIYIQNSDLINNSNNNNNTSGKSVNYSTGDKGKNINSSSGKNNIGSLNNNVNSANYNSYDNRNMNNNNVGYNSNQGYNPLIRPNSVGKKDNNYSLNNLYQQQNIDNSRSQVISSNVGINNKDNDFGFNIVNDKLLNRSLETQKIMQNNYFNNQNVLDKQFKIIDYNTGSNQNMNKKTNKNSFNQNVSANNALGQSNNTGAGLNYNKNTGNAYQGVSLNNYQPELNKKNIGSTNQAGVAASLLNRPSSQMMKHGPVKIQNEYDKKPSTPDVSYNKYNSNSNNNYNLSVLRPNNNPTSLSNKPYSSNQSGSVVKRSNSYKKLENNDRPSTAPQKNDKEEKPHASQLNMKRLPSPNLKGPSNGLGNSYKPSISSNYSGIGSNPVYNSKGGLGSKLSGTLGNNQGKSYANRLKKK